MDDNARREAAVDTGAGDAVRSGWAFDGSGTERSLDPVSRLVIGRGFSASIAADASFARNVSSRLRSDPLRDDGRKLQLPLFS